MISQQISFFVKLLWVKTVLSIQSLFYPQKNASRPKIGVVAFFQNDEGFLREWILFYLSQGVQKVFLIDNFSTDNSCEELQPFIDANWVELYKAKKGLSFKDQVVEGFNRVSRLHKKNYDYFLFIDSDEFLVFPEGDSLVQWTFSKGGNGFVFNWSIFGHNQVRELKDSEFMIERLNRRFVELHDEHFHVKSLVSTRVPFRFINGNPHYPELPWGKRLQWPSGEDFHSTARKIDFSKGKIHHYWYRTLTFYQTVKVPRRKAFDGGRDQNIEKWHQESANEVLDNGAHLYIAAMNDFANNHNL